MHLNTMQVVFKQPSYATIFQWHYIRFVVETHCCYCWERSC